MKNETVVADAGERDRAIEELRDCARSLGQAIRLAAWARQDRAAEIQIVTELAAAEQREIEQLLSDAR